MSRKIRVISTGEDMHRATFLLLIPESVYLLYRIERKKLYIFSLGSSVAEMKLFLGRI
jgi:hypothetical protein